MRYVVFLGKVQTSPSGLKFLSPDANSKKYSEETGQAIRLSKALARYKDGEIVEVYIQIHRGDLWRDLV